MNIRSFFAFVKMIMRLRLSMSIGIIAVMLLSLYPFATHAVELTLALDEFVTITGASSNDQAGASSALADVNGDGYEDIVIGAYQYSGDFANIGAAHIVYGSSEGIAEIPDLDTEVTFTGEANNDFAGFAVGNAGDVNGDGYEDILVGAYRDDTAGTDAGAVYLIYGQEENLTSASLSTAVKFTGESANDNAGQRGLSSAGDLNGDGYDDFLIGVAGNDSDTGAVYLFYGQAEELTSKSLSTAVKFTGENVGDDLGTSAAGVGDLNGDGYDDVVLGAPDARVDGTSVGAAYILYGQAEAYTSASIATAIALAGENGGDDAGFAVSAAGDLNGDGYADFAVCAKGEDTGASGAGAIYLVYGQASEISAGSLASYPKIVGENASDQFGQQLSSAGDIDNDGYDDIITGSNQTDEVADFSGSAYIIFGQSATLSSGSASEYLQFLGENERDYAGRSVAGGGDVNGDGYDDVVIGASGYGDTGTGQVYLLQVAGSTVTVTNNTDDVNTVECGVDTFIDPGATGADQYLDSQLNITTTGSVNEETPGEYILTYVASNLLSVLNTVSRTVTVEDTTAPSITLAGSSSVTVAVGQTYTDAGAIASDACDGTLTNDIEATTTVNTATAGTYTVTYSVEDSSDNEAEEVVRTVTVEAADEGEDDTDNDAESGEGDGSGDTEETLGAVESLTRLSNNTVQVTYENGSTKTFQLFPNGSAKAKVQLHTNGNILIAINKKFIRTYDAFTGDRLYSKKLFKKKQYKTKFKRYNVYKKQAGKNNIMVLAQTKKKHKKQFKLKAFVVQAGGKIVVRNTQSVTTNKNTAISKLNTKKNKKNGKKARIIVTRKGKNLADHKYKVTKKKGRIVLAQ